MFVTVKPEDFLFKFLCAASDAVGIHAVVGAKCGLLVHISNCSSAGSAHRSHASGGALKVARRFFNLFCRIPQLNVAPTI